ncbi:MAG: siroheme synthase CysG, partial [Gammaproteobacteria bacterium]
FELKRRKFAEADLDRRWLVVTATSDHSLNAQVAAAAESRQIFCNVVDEVDLCTYITPAIVERAPVTVAISSGGRSPVLVRWVKGVIESLLPKRLGKLTDLAGRWRQRVGDSISNVDERRRFWERILNGPAAEQVYAGRDAQADATIEQALVDWHSDADRTRGEAYLVGAGPGAADLITLRGRQLLAQADVVLYDRLVGIDVLDYARRDAELISVGKQPGQPSIAQEQINRLLVQLVGRGKRVCRLKGGDPMIFGRAGEEIDALVSAGQPFQIVPGVSAVSACAAYAGIPLTLRGVARSVVLTTGHVEDSADFELGPLRKDQTLALYMGVAQYGAIADRLIASGTDPKTSVAVIEKGTTEKQRVISTVLDKLADAALDEDVRPPALLLIGETTSLATRYSWFAPESLVRYKNNGESGLARVS